MQFLRSLQISIISFSSGRSTPLLNLALEHRNCGATDTRDKTFALYGLASDAGPESLGVNIDYSITAQEVYKAFATAVLKTSSTLDLLSVPRLPIGQGLVDLPSWVPDWSAASASIPLLHEAMQYGYLFASNALKDIKPEFSLSNNGARLRLEGFIVDEIIGVASLFLATLSSMVTISKVWNIPNRLCRRNKIILEWQRLVLHDPEGLYPSGETVFEAYMQVLLASNPFQKYYQDCYIKFHHLRGIYVWLLSAMR